jgi:hypothetical protein
MRRKPDNAVDRQYTLSFDEAKAENSGLQVTKKLLKPQSEGKS